MTGKITLAALVVGLAASAVLPAVARAETYEIKDLGVPPVAGHTRSFGYALNQAGQVAGYSGTWSAVFGANDQHAVFYDGTSMRDLGSGRAWGINAAGHVVGHGSKGAFVYDGVGITWLGTISGKGFSAAYGINADGTIVGTSVIRTGELHAFVRTRRKLQDLGTLPGTTHSEAQAVNTAGQIAGHSWNVTSVAVGHRAFVYDGSMRDIGTLGGAEAMAFDINDAGSVVGKAQTPFGTWSAYKYAAGVMHDLGGIGGTASVAYGMNNRGEVVGESGGRAFLHSDGTMIDLNSLLPSNSGWFLREAQDITDGGVIVGTGLYGGEYRAFLLEPTVLGRYVPRLRHDFQEVYRPDSAATITDNYTSIYTNRLLDAAGTVLAASDPADPADTLGLDYLDWSYPTGRAAVDGDYIDEANDNRDGDAQRLHDNPLYANKVYGREIELASGTLLQYWVFYYNNPKVFASTLGGFGDHEGDWEMIQVRLDANDTPVGATYAQHRTGEYCPWDNVQRTQSGRPVVYVAHESHAGYFTAGDHRIVVDNLPDQWDYADGEGEAVVPALIEVTAPPTWMRWPGQWGGSDSSPRSPLQQGRWADPQGFEASAAGCTAPASTSFLAARPARPPAPQIEARRVGGKVIVDYRFAPDAKGAEPWLLVTTVDGPKDRFTPTSERTILAGSTAGRIVQPVGLARGPLRVLASVRAKNGARSRIVIAPVR